jgi:hypothetical protein
MAKRMNWWKKFRGSLIGRSLEVILYAVLLVMICLYFTGNGTFVYEGF